MCQHDHLLKLSDASFMTCSAVWPVLMMASLSVLLALFSALMVLVEVSLILFAVTVKVFVFNGIHLIVGMVSLSFCCSGEFSLALV
jgi:hypothetical protein